MGEKAKGIGEKLEGFGSKLYSGFGWDELLRDQEIKCHKGSQHKKKTHGIDLLHTCYDPYRSQTTAIVTECKNRQWINISTSTLSQWIQELEFTIDCAQNSAELKEVDFKGGSVNTGILLVHANDGLFSEKDFYRYLSEVSIKTRRSPINIFVAGNDRIDRWHALLDQVDKLDGDIKYVYPSIDKSNYIAEKYLTINHLFSKFIFARRSFDQTIGKTTGHCTQHIVFSFDTFSKESFRYLCSLFKHFQFESGDEYQFYFYPRQKEDIEFTHKNFLQALKDVNNANSLLDEEKIKISFLNNRHISPVYNS